MSSNNIEVNENEVKEIAGKVLGKTVGESKHYDKSLLVPVPRNMSIAHIGVKMEELEGQGFDLWYNYEFRCLLDNGMPVTLLLKFIFPHTTENIIESKSLKLYCNSFFNEKMGKTKKEAQQNAAKSALEKEAS